jgi:glycerophosphoryl diester phosphodiesterase
MTTHPFLAGLRPTLHIAHRGGARLAPENTMLAFRQAVETYGTDMIETDVHLTRDGEVVVFHDDTLGRCTDGFGPLSDRTWAELSSLDAGYRWTEDGATFPFRGQGARIPRLVEVLRAFPDLRLNVDLKPAVPGLAEAFVGVVRAEKATGRICAGSEHDALAATLADLAPELCLFYPRRALTDLVTAIHRKRTPPDDPRFLVLDMPYRLGPLPIVNGRLLGVAARMGRWVNVWTVDDERDMRRLARLGVGGIMTDRPDRLRAILEETRMC